MRPHGHKFVNISIKFRFPKYQLVCLVRERKELHGEICDIIHSAATRIILRIVRTNIHFTRVPKNLGSPYPNPSKFIIKDQPC